ncbi:MAG: methyltransferase domain-containing protein [Candidatus Alcyoniella australis]|nr:methyltransferase domain-containing protein [Candidatus Alcyoniella australis]
MRQTEQQIRGELDFRSFHGEFVDRFIGLFQSLLRMRVPTFDRLVFERTLRPPFLEIGAELGLNGALLASRHGYRGFCLDISPEALLTGREYRRRMGLEREAMLICADAHNLPLRNDSLPTVFGWGTFHHFPDPLPVLREARRVLNPNGRFLFEEEPIKRRLSLNLYNTGTPPHELRWFERVLFRLGLLPFIAVPGGRDEVARGIHEGTFGVAQLRRLLGVFDEQHVSYTPQLTGGIAAEGRPLRWLLPRMLGVQRAFAWATRWFGGASAGWAIKHTIGCRVLDGDPRVALVKRRDPLDRLTLYFDAPTAVRLIDGGGSPQTTQDDDSLRVDLPQDWRDEVVALELQGEAQLLRVDLESSSVQGAFYSWRPADEHEDAATLESRLGCPECITVSDRCLAPRCGWPCVAACPNGALTRGEKGPMRDAQRCTLCLDCLHACPFGVLDRAPLELEGELGGEGRLTCRDCGRSFIIRDGIAILLTAEKQRLMGDRWR